GGELTLKGVGEDMPTELEAVIPGYEEFPKGYTIGPVDSLNTLSANDHAKYIQERLPQFEVLGWVTASAREWYEKNLTTNNFDAVLRRAEQDLGSEQITSEVFAIIQSIKHSR
ncbi:MAG TPA: hypothetical protein VJ124_19775, partial [Pyrinomonadaceae bacterium]|nr:hypothetical protein [Pyrinomonadaceae bacterium]